MKHIGLVTVGQDAELFYTTDAKPIGSIRVWYKFGRDGSFQWLDLKLIGERAEKVVPMLKKSKRIEIVASDLHIEAYDKKGGQAKGFKLVGILDSFEFAERREDAPTADRRPLPGTAAFDAQDEEVPF